MNKTTNKARIKPGLSMFSITEAWEGGELRSLAYIPVSPKSPAGEKSALMLCKAELLSMLHSTSFSPVSFWSLFSSPPRWRQRRVADAAALLLSLACTAPFERLLADITDTGLAPDPPLHPFLLAAAGC